MAHKYIQEEGEHNIIAMSAVEAVAYSRDDCPYCQTQLKYAIENNLQVIVNTYTRDVVGVVIETEDEE